LKVNVNNGAVHVENRQVPDLPFKDTGAAGYITLIYLSSCLRFHRIETLPVLIAAGLLAVICRRELRATRMMRSDLSR
jgi:hypothetical protein